MRSRSLLARTFSGGAAALFLGALLATAPPTAVAGDLPDDPAERCSGRQQPVCGEETTCVGFLWARTCQTLYYYYPGDGGGGDGGELEPLEPNY